MQRYVKYYSLFVTLKCLPSLCNYSRTQLEKCNVLECIEMFVFCSTNKYFRNRINAFKMFLLRLNCKKLIFLCIPSSVALTMLPPGYPSCSSTELVKSPFQTLRQQISLTEIMTTSRSDASQFLENMEDTGLQEHTDDNCLYCVCSQILDYQHNKVNSAFSHTGEHPSLSLI